MKAIHIVKTYHIDNDNEAEGILKTKCEGLNCVDYDLYDSPLRDGQRIMKVYYIGSD
jgi:hypothetical protein